MVFSSLSFICIFLPLVFLLHLAVPGIRLKNTVLLIFSLLFYAYGEPVYIVLLILSACMNYLFGRMIGKNKSKTILALSVICNLALLIVFKYTGFLAGLAADLTGLPIPVPEIRLPIGISFFTFQAMSYVIDVYRDEASVAKRLDTVMLYLAFFPQLIAGPIVKYKDIDAMMQDRKVETTEAAAGLRRFIYGLGKKVLISNTVAATADALFAAGTGQINFVGAWIGAIAYMLQIYFDFSGYSDMAIGMGKMFGFTFKENFNYPYISGSIQEFWRRWHISLSTWFKEYVYIPLGGNRKGKARAMLNRCIVFLCTGIWHGANLTFLFWGIYHGFFLVMESQFGKYTAKLPGKKVLSRIYALLVVCVGFVFFRAESLSQGFWWVKMMFTGFFTSSAAMSFAVQQLTPLFLGTVVLAVIGATPVLRKIKKNGVTEFLSYACSFVILGLCILQLASNSYNPFIYFQF